MILLSLRATAQVFAISMLGYITDCRAYKASVAYHSDRYGSIWSTMAKSVFSCFLVDERPEESTYELESRQQLNKRKLEEYPYVNTVFEGSATKARL